MAEIALIASIVQIADTGYRLSLKLYTSGEAISSADRAIITISKDISLTSTVLKELGEILGRDRDEKERICSENLVQTAGNTVKECLDVFEELDKMILKNMPNLSQGHRATRATMALEKLKWPFIQPRIQLLRGSLDMLRANISLMLNVMIYARHVSERKKSRPPAPDGYDEAGQRTLIEQLANAKEEYIRRFESLKLSSHATRNVPNIGSRATPAHREGNVGPTQHSFNPLSRAAFESTAATQLPLPNIPASYPTVSKNSVAVQSDEYILWQLLDHFDALMNGLIREVYSPEYRIPAESRSRFTGAIREAHTLEVVEAQTREPTTWKPKARRAPIKYKRSSRRARIGSPQQSVSPKRQRTEHEDGSEAPAADLVTSAYQGGDFPQAYPVAALGFKMRASAMSSQTTRQPNISFEARRCYLPSARSVQEADKNDVVDDLVRLWTLVR